MVSVAILSEPRRGAIVDVVGSEPSVAPVAASWPGFLGGLGGAPAYAEGAGGREITSYQFVSPEFFDVLSIDLVRGRGFAAGERNANEAVAIVSETAARELWPGVDALGQVVRLTPDATILQPASEPPPEPSDDPRAQPRTAVVIGVARDVAGFRLGGFRVGGAGVYMPTDTDATGTALLVRVRGDAETARRALSDRLAAIDPSISQVGTLDTIASAETFILGISFWLTLVLGGLALLLTLSGLFSVLSYLVEQRTREIGVRMALGEQPKHRLARGLAMARPVGLGLLIGAALAAGLGGLLLSTPAAEQIGSTVLLFDPVAYAGSMLFVIAACAAAALAPALRGQGQSVGRAAPGLTRTKIPPRRDFAGRKNTSCSDRAAG